STPGCAWCDRRAQRRPRLRQRRRASRRPARSCAGEWRWSATPRAVGPRARPKPPPPATGWGRAGGAPAGARGAGRGRWWSRGEGVGFAGRVLRGATAASRGSDAAQELLALVELAEGARSRDRVLRPGDLDAHRRADALDRVATVDAHLVVVAV